MDRIEQCASLDSVDADVLRKWGSAWLDLRHADSVLEARLNTPVTPSNLFVRRALWEAAVISYGRVGQSTRRRKIDLAGLFAASGDPDASNFHDTIKEWRHGHVAHRADAAFESVDALLCVDASLTPSALKLVIETDIGPQDDEQLAEKFRAHVILLHNTIWERFMVPLAAKLTEKAQRNTVDPGSVMPYPTPSAHGFIATLTLWDRSGLSETA
ncbi:hypothetical protein [Nocardia sp. NPDC004260]